jgi:hypothetical protein
MHMLRNYNNFMPNALLLTQSELIATKLPHYRFINRFSIGELRKSRRYLQIGMRKRSWASYVRIEKN